MRSVLTSARISGQRAYAPTTRADPAAGREILGAGDWEPIITPEETAQIRAILADPARRRTTPARATLLGGIARCGSAAPDSPSQARTPLPATPSAACARTIPNAQNGAG